ncbi:YceI family protein [Scleromatobacter humisilvae]|uniref:YceI family protein n=1 Tax=Scleromatobacter humisilvae TaxID=2897159 RepID=A0A9X2C1N0_9BURK|nr:YceI family protein [Scleromatobacter humisilvae]MCK9687736.1 YceI family protein [Scleromatobacter humisilvae]
MLKIRTAVVLAASLALTGVAFAQAKVVPAQSQITFAIKEMGVPVEGKFGKWTADIAFDPKQPAAGKVAFTIVTASASFGVPETDAEVPKPEWFNVAKFPNATFASTAITAKGGGKFDVAGKLTVKGTTKDVVVPIALTQAGPTTTATGAFTIKRNDFKVGEGEWKDTSQLADDVSVKFKIALTGVAPL